ncbi:DNA (cytosine-5-)-methyltransferase [Lactococcus hircilactis]|uniref:Cytosine-specific methyltransferase n=1 Tax=Lactococcus hircilactis TaxID=1494462 RepID=A0A7X2D2X9_9LACT|nr:DNA (cytosine-5-)-methyltransferase [Lactococcus hircilactis]MQW40585.1 DNA (cytosine-5-)-methyltransferase [Lactococcus hircilactis]
MKFLDLFAGIGGFRLGLEQAGHECVGFCEIDKFARQSYKAIHNTEGEREYHDITTVSNEEWRTLRGTVDLICGGFPCQAFSIAGKRKGFLDETRGTLFFEIARAAEQIKPRTLFLENVRGLLSHDKGRTFRTIISTLDELGYDAEWQILNSKNFGVPQNRERVFIIGHLRGERGREVFPITRENSGAIDVVNKESGMPRETNRVYSSEGLSPTLNTMQGGGREPKIAIPVLTPDRAEKRQNGRRFKEDGDPMFTITAQDRHGVILSGNINPSENGMNGNVYDSDGLAPTLTTNKGEGPKIVQKPRGYNKGGEHEVAPTLSSNSWHENNLLKVGGIYKNVSKTHQRGVLPGLSRTLKSQNHDAGIFDGIRIRKLTPRECWRLQGFPDWAFDKAQEVNSNSQLYKQAGNSVTVPVIYEIARRFE